MTKVAILIDGGFFLKKLKTVQPNVLAADPIAVTKSIGSLVGSHLKQIHQTHGGKTHWGLLYRCFFYDAKPYLNKVHTPVAKRLIDYAKSDQARFRLALFDQLRRTPNFAVRLGETIAKRHWILSETSQKDLLNGKRDWSTIVDDDFVTGIQQKAVDMRIGLDIASISLKKQADTIVLVTGDSDFVPAAKLARREGVRIILDPLWQGVRPDLFEHIDLLRSGFPKPGKGSEGPIV